MYKQEYKSSVLIIVPFLLLIGAFGYWSKSEETITVYAKTTESSVASPSAAINPTTKFITVKVSHYWPDLGGVNCLTFKDGHCVSKMANGQKWEKGVGIAIACPQELKMGTRIRIGDRIWTCMDRGSAIVKDGDAYWVDQLTPEALYPFGKEVEAELYLN